MGEWKPGQKLVGPDGERGIYLPHDVRILGPAADPTNSRYKPVDDWPDPVAEARKRVRQYLTVPPGRPRPEPTDTRINAFIRDCAADLRILLDAQEAEG